MFKVNEANWDRIARVVLGIILLVLGLAGTVTGILGIIFDVIGLILLVTGLVGVCPLYMLLKFSAGYAPRFVIPDDREENTMKVYDIEASEGSQITGDKSYTDYERA
jgi:Inner membrane protein YgaP-like, transmembrane domain